MNRLIFVLTCLAGYALAGDRDIGKKCTANYMCQKSNDFTFISIFDDAIVCIEGYCKCKPAVEIRYSGSMEPSCESFQHGLRVMRGRCNSTSCNANEECVNMREKGDTTWHYKKLCYCKEGFLRVDGDCSEVTYVGALDQCGRLGGEAKACDLEDHSKCHHGRCICFDDYFANQTSKKCEPMANYLKTHNLREYRVKPNEYCTRDSQCISGLDCRALRCACPLPCTYNSTLEICDCGKEDVIPAGPFIVGIILGILIMGFWYAMIVRTVRKMRAKPRSSLSHLSRPLQEPPTTNTYSLDPVRATSDSNNRSSAPVGLSVPTSSGSGRQSPSPSRESVPSPPLASRYGLNPSQDPPPYIYPTAPPAYSELTMTRDPSPPPYSLNPPPPPYAAVAPPHPADSTSLPYSINPSNLSSVPPNAAVTPPYPSDSSNAPYSGNPSDFSSAPPNTAVAPPYPSDSSNAPYSGNPSDLSSSPPNAAVAPPYPTDSVIVPYPNDRSDSSSAPGCQK